MKFFSFIIVLISFVGQLYSVDAIAYDNKITHRYINAMAVKNKAHIDSYLKTSLGMHDGIDTIVGIKPILEWIRDGGFEEDEPFSRCFKHFHNPLEQDWDDAGLIFLDDIGLKWFRSMVYWSQAPDNEYSWPKAKEYYYQALRTGSEDYYIKTFRSLGQVMHLVSDAAVPAHVRNDPHLPGDPDFYERWVKNESERETLENIEYDDFYVGISIFDMAVSNSSAPSPISALWDHNEYNEYDGSVMPNGTNNTIGLAEYTNANFWTEDTINDYPHPSFEDINFDEDLFREIILAENSESHNRFYLSKQNGDPIDHFFTVGYWFYHLSESAEYDDTKKEALRLTYKLDEKCCTDYARKLIPRAIGYSAALLDYFFRGSIEITLPSNQYHSGVYSMIEDPDQGFTHIILNARNITPSGEKMTNGSIEIVVKYKLIENGEDPFQSKYIEPSKTFSCITATTKSMDDEGNVIGNIPRNESIELEFDLSPALPQNATDVTINLVYRGVLGNEQDAIAVGYKDISEPTPWDVYSNLDKVCLAGEWYNAGSKAAIDIVDDNKNGIIDNGEIDVNPHNTRNMYIRFSSVSDPQFPLRQGEDIYISEIQAGEYKRLVFILGDDEFAPRYISLDLEPDETGTVNSVRRQANIIPSFLSFRGIEMKGYRLVYKAEDWGHSNACSLDDVE